MEHPPVGEFARNNLKQIFDHCRNVDPEELTKLADKEYCNEVFKLHFAFWATPEEAALIKKASKDRDRYLVEVHHVLGHEVRLTSQWFKRNYPPLVRYMVDKGLTPIGLSPEAVDKALDELAKQKTVGKSPGGARHSKTPIGDPQNGVVRHVMGCIKNEAFSEKDWLAVKKSFGHRCVYCSSGRQLVMDHAVPISTIELGEHRLGNLVPACRTCNTAKSEMRYDTYLRMASDLPDPAGRIATIEAHMRQHGYVPLTDTLTPEAADVVRATLHDLRGRVAAAAVTAIAAINDSLREGQSR